MLVRRIARGKETLVIAPTTPVVEVEPPLPFSAASGEFADIGGIGGGEAARESTRRPRAEEDRDTLLVIFPGFLFSPSQYEPLAQAIQTKTSTRLFVVVPKFVRNVVPGERAAEVALDECITLAANEGFRLDVEYGGGRASTRPGVWQSSQLYVVGHSWGGFMMRSLALERAAGAVFLNSFLGTTHDFKTGVSNPVARAVVRTLMHADAVYPTGIAEWPKPVMLLGGDRDGQMRMSYLAEAAGAVDAFRGGANVLNEHAHAEKSVVVIAGLNHRYDMRVCTCKFVCVCVCVWLSRECVYDEYANVNITFCPRIIDTRLTTPSV